jgi:hypothetical protein
VFGEFGGNDYNAMIFGGYTIEQARKYTPKIVNTISRGIDVSEHPQSQMQSQTLSLSQCSVDAEHDMK